MKGLMSRMQNEKGNTLLLVLFLVFLLSAISAPLLLSLSQGNVNNKKGERTEQAQYAAESGMAIVKRVMEEAFYKEKMELNTSQVSAIINGVNNIPDVSVGTTEVKVEGVKLESTGKSLGAVLPRTRTMSMNYLAQQGTAAVPGVFGKDVVSYPSLSDKNVFEAKGIVENYMNFKSEFVTAFENLMKKQPVASNFSVPIPNPACSYANVRCSGDDIFIDDQNSGANIPVDVIAKGNITISTGLNVIINGNLVAGGKITHTRQAQLVVTKSIIANGAIEFGDIQNIVVNGDISSNTSAKLANNINGSFQIDGSVYVNNPCLANNTCNNIETYLPDLKNIKIKGSILSTNKIRIGNMNEAGEIGGALLTLGDLEFGTMKSLTVKQTVGCLGNLKTQNLNDNNVYWGGAAIGGTFLGPQGYNSFRIHIRYFPPGGGDPAERKLIFSDWKSQ